MGASATFPVDCDYALGLDREDNSLRTRVESGRMFLRQKAADPRIFTLVFNQRSKADWNSIIEFWHLYKNDFFTWHDKESGTIGGFAGRKYSVRFVAPPKLQIAGYEQYYITVQVMEAIGVAMATYPDFGGNYPSKNILVAAATDLGGNGKMFLYAGYGYRVNGSFTNIYLDELLTGGDNPKTDVVLGLHRVRITGGPPTSLDYLI